MDQMYGSMRHLTVQTPHKEGGQGGWVGHSGESLGHVFAPETGRSFVPSLVLCLSFPWRFPDSTIVTLGSNSSTAAYAMDLRVQFGLSEPRLYVKNLVSTVPISWKGPASGRAVGAATGEKG